MRSIILSLVALSGTTFAATDPKITFFETQVVPLLKQHCYECHSHDAGKTKGGLVLDSRSGWMVGGDSGRAIVPGNADASLLMKAIQYVDSDLEMPPNSKLPDDAIAVFKKWIADGAVDPRVGIDSQEASQQVSADELWSLQPLKVTPAPKVDGADGLIDRWVQSELKEAGLPPADPADARTLIRRLYLDLKGLSPSPDQVAAFVEAESKDRKKAVESVVDELLSSEDFGERWARHWLDLVAYADTIGIGRSIPATEAWRYRDYVINAFNSDKPFDQFIYQQIAGDAIQPPGPGTKANGARTAEDIIATGFLVIGPWELVGGNKVQLRMDVVDRQVHRVGQAFLGMTFGCARCHEHKFDPISQEDYYAMAGFFTSTVTLNGRLGGVFSNVNYRALPETADELMARADRIREFESQVAITTKLRSEADCKSKELATRIEVLEKEVASSATGEDQSGKSEEVDKLKRERDAANKESRKHADRLKVLAYIKPSRTQNRAMATMDTPEPMDCRINIRGNAHQLGDRVPRGFPKSIAPTDKPMLTRGGSGRIQFAQWIANEKNPLTARVWVNRVWHHLFGAGLVRTVDNFGSTGETPSHPELLDALANRFMKEGWSTKTLIRHIVTSHAWGQASNNAKAMTAGVTESDPENRLLWRMNRRRLEAEAIRDTMLAVSGQLVVKRGGPSLPLETPGNANISFAADIRPHAKFPGDLGKRRSIYLPQRRKAPFDAADLLAAFDLPDTDQETGRRALTAVPTQALFLANSPFVQQQGKSFADRFKDLSEVERVTAMYETAYNRPPDADEHEAALAFAKEVSWPRLGQSLLMSSEFLFRN